MGDRVRLEMPGMTAGTAQASRHDDISLNLTLGCDLFVCSAQRAAMSDAR
jgi:hypothetical protein